MKESGKMKKTVLKITTPLLVLLIGGAVLFYLYFFGLFKPAHGFVKPSEGQIKVACVGDSVTYGMTMKNWRKNAYPFVLRDVLGDEYCVENFGFSGRTVMNSGDRPYMKTKLYKQSLEFEPDIVVLQMGSNDSKGYNFKTAEAFREDYVTLLESYLSLPSKPRVIICTCPPAFRHGLEVKFDINANTVEHEIVPVIREVAEEYGLDLIDLMEQFYGKPKLFNDGLHPNIEGARIITDSVAELIMK